MDPVLLTLQLAEWSGCVGEAAWVQALEAGRVLFFPQLRFDLEPAEAALLSPALLARGSRNVSLDFAGQLKGAAVDGVARARLAGMMARFATDARKLIRNLFGAYDAHLRPAPTSLRPVEAATRSQSVRADDRRLHIDAFPSRPTHGERILRVFTNIDPQGRPRVWRIGEPFEDVARHFLPQAAGYSPWRARMLASLGITKSLRGEYDHLMVQLHDRMKQDEAYQRTVPQVVHPFPSGCTWICFSDQVSHAVVSGQHMLEQTLHLPVQRQCDPAASPLATLTRLAGRPLAGGLHLL